MQLFYDFKKIEKSNKFYEQSGLGGNTLIWVVMLILIALKIKKIKNLIFSKYKL